MNDEGVMFTYDEIPIEMHYIRKRIDELIEGIVRWNKMLDVIKCQNLDVRAEEDGNTM